MQVHSFKGEQHFLPEATSFKVTEFKEEKEGIKFYHVLAGEGVAKFEDKQLATSVGYAGELTFSFRVRPEYRKSPI